jgi:lipopolysaccharide transport system ATP-binding protein
MCDKVLLLDRGERIIYGGALEATRVYQKLMYAPADQKHRLVQQYRAAEVAGQSISAIEPRDLPKGEGDSCDEYDPSLVPDTTMAYPVQGAEIHSIQIFNSDGKKVNVLRQGAVYRLQINGSFLLDAENLYFAIHIRTISGAVITGQRYPEEGAYVNKVFAGQSFKSNFTIRMDLLPGAYFVGGGVWSSNEPNCLHRILDAAMFRVVQVDKMRSYGLVNLMAGEPELEVIK